MTTGRAARVVAVLAGLAAGGCVDRRFVIESNIPNAQVYIDNQPIGAAPAHSPFEYYGYYTVTLVHPGYETLTKRVHVIAPWYAYPPFDFLTEVVWPFHVRDTRRYYFELHEATKTRVDDLLNAADALRQHGQNLPAPERPAIPKAQPAPAPLPPGAVPVAPPVGPQPGLVPSVLPPG
jgi:PEGA domain